MQVFFTHVVDTVQILFCYWPW